MLRSCNVDLDNAASAAVGTAHMSGEEGAGAWGRNGKMRPEAGRAYLEKFSRYFSGRLPQLIQRLFLLRPRQFALRYSAVER